MGPRRSLRNVSRAPGGRVRAAVPVLVACFALACCRASADTGGDTAVRADSASGDTGSGTAVRADSASADRTSIARSGIDSTRVDRTSLDSPPVDRTPVDPIPADSVITGALVVDPMSTGLTSATEEPELLDTESAESADGADRVTEFSVHQDRYLAAERRCLENGADQLALIVASELLLAAESLALAGELGAALELVDEAIAELEAAVHSAPVAPPGP